MKKKKKFYYVLGLLIISLIAYTFGFLYTNYYKLKNNNVNLNITNIQNATIKNNKIFIQKGTTNIILEPDNCSYINEFIFNYQVKNSFAWTIEIYGKNGYNADTYARDDGYSSPIINIFDKKINSKTCKVSLTINTEENFEIDNIRVNNNISYISKTILLFIVFFLAIYNFVIFRKKLSQKPENLFLYVALIIGISMTFFLPFGLAKSWDDEYHFTQAYGIANKYHTEASKEFLSQNNRWERFDTEKENKEYIKYLNKHNVKTKEKTNVNINFRTIIYTPYIIGFIIGNILHLSFYVTIILSLLLNLFTYIIITYFAIKNTPIAKKLMLSIGLLPTTMFISVNFNYDIIITSCLLLGFSYFLKELYSNDKINYKNIVIILLSFVFGSISKQIYIPFILLIFLFPKKKYSSKKIKIIIKTATIFSFIFMIASFVLPMMVANTVGSDSRGGNTNGDYQLKIIIDHPLTSVKVYKENMGDNFMDKFFGIETLSCNIWMKNRFVYNVYYIYFIILIFSTILAYENNTKKELTKKQKFFIILITLIIIVAIWTSLFLSYTEIGQTTIKGVQGRYFIPILFPLLLCFTTNKIKYKLNEEKVNYTISLILLIIICYSLLQCLV